MASTTPPFSPMRIRPSHRLITPVRPSAISKPVLAESNSEPTTSWKISGRPNATAWTMAAANAMRKKAAQIQLSIGGGEYGERRQKATEHRDSQSGGYHIPAPGHLSTIILRVATFPSASRR